MDNEPKPKKKRRVGRPPKHGGFSLVNREDLVKEHPELRRYLEDCRDGLIDDLTGGDEAALTAGQQILVDRITQKLSLARLIEIYISKTGILRRDKPEGKVMEVEPILIYWQSLNHAIRADLQLLGIKRVDMGAKEEPLALYLRSKKESEGKAKEPPSYEA